MPTLIEEEERQKFSRLSNNSIQDAANDVPMKTFESAKESGVGTIQRQNGTEMKEDIERDGQEEDQGNGEEGQNCDLGPISSTPASKSSDSQPQVKKSESFHDCLGAGSDFDRFSITSMASLPEGLFEGFIRHKDGSSIRVVFQVSKITPGGITNILHLYTILTSQCEFNAHHYSCMYVCVRVRACVCVCVCVCS